MNQADISNIGIQPGILTEWAQDAMTATCYAAVPVAGVVTLALASRLAYGRITQHLNDYANHNQRDMRNSRQTMAERCRTLNEALIPAGFAMTVAAVALAVLGPVSALTGACLIAGIVLSTLGAIGLNQLVHEHLASHDGRWMPGFLR